MRPYLLFTAIAAMVSAGGNVRADFYLVGFDVYSSTASGANANATYRYSSNSNDGSAVALLTPTSPPGASQTKAISFLLANGANTFNFAATSPFNPGAFAGVEFFFNTTGVSFNPADKPHAGDLAVFASTSGGAFQNPANGTQILDYGPNGGNATYLGGSSVTLGGQAISVTAFSIDTFPSGSFTLNVSPAAVPEPSSLMMSGMATIVLGITARAIRRRLTPA